MAAPTSSLPPAELGRIVFLDFEASSLGRKGFPIKVVWVF
jgi:hypothetical protein